MNKTHSCLAVFCHYITTRYRAKRRKALHDKDHEGLQIIDILMFSVLGQDLKFKNTLRVLYTFNDLREEAIIRSTYQ